MSELQERAAAMIRLAIAKAGLRQIEVCRRTGIDEGNLSRYINGSKDPQFATVLRILGACGLEIHFFKM